MIHHLATPPWFCNTLLALDGGGSAPELSTAGVPGVWRIGGMKPRVVSAHTCLTGTVLGSNHRWPQSPAT
jgi:hypothetical protein